MKIPVFIVNGLNNYFRFVVGGVIAVIAISGYVLLLAPKITSVQTSQVSAQKNAEADLVAKQAHAAALRESNAKFEQAFPAERLDTINNFLPASPDFPRLLLMVKNLIAGSQLTLDSFTLVSAQGDAPATQKILPTASDIHTADITISVSGGSTYELFKNLLANLESSQPLLDVVSLNFKAALPDSAGAAQTGPAAVIWNFTLRTYYLPKT